VHLTIVFAALAIDRWTEDAYRIPHTGWSIRAFVRTARRYRTIEMQAGAYPVTAADPYPSDLRDDTIEAITRASRGGHQLEPSRASRGPAGASPRRREWARE
jgi:hypothetical protein